MKVAPPNGGSNQRERTKCDSFVRTSSRVASSSAATESALRPAATQASGSAHIFEKRLAGAASGSISASTSAEVSHRSVSGSRLWPVVIACARKMPLMPPADAPAMMSARTRKRMPASDSISSISAR